MSQQNKDLIKRLVDGVWIRRDLSVFDAVFSDGFVDRTPRPGMDAGKAAFKQMIVGLQAAFSDDHTTIDDLVAEGDKVAWRWTYRGKNTGSFMGMPSTGKQITLSGFTIDRIDNGRIVERWHMMDTAGLMQQLGAAPPPAR